MVWTEPWTYMGGSGLAGFHFEDGLLHFGHHLIDCSFKFDPDADPIDIRLLNIWKRFSRKTWVVSKVGGIKGVLECNKILADDMSLLNVGDAMLMSRMFVLDPRDFVDSDKFSVIYQNPGEFIFGDLGHSVTGFGLLSFAWNFALEDNITNYIRAERNMASIIRKSPTVYKEQRAMFNGGFEPDLRSFTFINTMLDYVITNRGDDIIPAVFDKVKLCYTFEREMCSEFIAEFVADDEEFVPVNANDAQCTQCGISCMFAMFVVKQKGKGTKAPRLKPEALCHHCVKPYRDKKGSLQVVSLLSTFMASKFQIV